MKSCWFHYMQALQRNALKIPYMKRFLNSNQLANRHFRKFLYLPLLKPSDLIAAYEIIKDAALNTTSFSAIEGGESVFQPFIKYFERQWIKKVIRNICNSIHYLNLLHLNFRKVQLQYRFIFKIVGQRAQLRGITVDCRLNLRKTEIFSNFWTPF